MSLWKIPCLLMVWASYMVVSTPPTKTARPEDQKSYRGLSWSATMLQKRDIGLIIVNCFVSCVMLAELAFACGTMSYGINDKDSQSLHQSNAYAASPLFLVGVVCSVIGGTLRQWSYRAMGRHFTFQLAILKDHQLVTDGPYAYVRHPGYTALILTFVGMSACQLSAGSWWIEARVFDSVFGKFIGLLGVCAALQLITVVSRAPAEDRMLHEQFGRQWEEWAISVPYKCFPGIW
ncbi:hypothetical protein PENSPDRAFT_641323 [Peniophora sp. CONT]|nr:hypothetical protein PENSPDRAFT_641323 [Peniophora sp. CONT]